MAFIREYAAAGDPFSLRRPKWLRKIKPGRVLGKIAHAAAPFASFIPGAGPVLGKLLDKAMAQAAAVPGGQEELIDFARGYGFELGDPKPSARPRGGKPPKRKAAAAGPKAKAKAKATNRAAKSGPKGVDPQIIASIVKGAAAAGGAIAQEIPGLGTAIRAGSAAKDATRGMFGGGGKRRHMQVTNVKALRRGIRRLEGFEKLVRSLERAYPRIKRATHHSSSRGPRGHRSGCGCFACRKAA